MSSNCSENSSIDEMLDQLEMETAPWAEQETVKKVQETSFFGTLNCTEEPFSDDVRLNPIEQLKAKLDRFNMKVDPITYPSECYDTMAARSRQMRRSSIFPMFEEPTAFKFFSVLDQSADIGINEEPELVTVAKEVNLSTPPPQRKSDKKTASRKFQKIISRIRTIFNSKKM